MGAASDLWNMLYTASFYISDDRDLIKKVITENGFATVITHSNGLTVSHLPFMLIEEGDNWILEGHIARANSQWKTFEDATSVTLIFNGPHSYISPAWYSPKPDNVPTWNYVTVHIEGKAFIVPEPAKVFDILQRTVRHFEKQYRTGWLLAEVPNEGHERLMRGIVAFRIEITSLQGKFKLSQKQTLADRENVIERLESWGGEFAVLSQYMKATRPK